MLSSTGTADIRGTHRAAGLEGIPVRMSHTNFPPSILYKTDDEARHKQQNRVACVCVMENLL